MSFQDVARILNSCEKLDALGVTDGADDLENDVTSTYDTSKKGPAGNFYYPVEIEPDMVPVHHHSEDLGQLEHVRCGVACCKPKWTEKITNLPTFVLVYGIAGIWMTTTGSLLGSQITSIERHLGLSSGRTGLIMSGNDIGYLIFVLIGSHFGKYTRIPVCLSFSGIVFGLINMVMALGRFVELGEDMQTGIDSNISVVTDNHSDKYLCKIEELTYIDDMLTTPSLSTVGPAPTQEYHLSWGFWLLFFCAFIGGSVKSFRIPLLTHYVESNVVDKNRTGILIGTSFTAMLFGPPIALLLGSYISSLSLNLEDTEMSLLDQRWVGAWWLGFLVVGAACFISSIPIGYFPKRMYIRPESSSAIGQKDKGMVSKGYSMAQKTRKMISDLPKSVRRVLSQPVYVIALVASVIQSCAFGGYFMFSQKYIEVQFNKTSQDVSMTTGVVTIFSLALGTFCGGYLTTRLKLSLRGSVLIVIAVSVITLLLDLTSFVFGCSNSTIMGLDLDVDLLRASNQLTSCSCASDAILLSCGSDGRDYLSPCVAGCTNKSDMLFTDCQNIINNNSQELSPGLCALDCPFFIPYIAVYFVGSLIGCSAIVPQYLMIIRSVQQRDQSLAAGLCSFCQTLLGFLPSPIIYGKLVDGTCRLWHPTGSYCMLYDRDQFRYQFKGLHLSLRFSTIPLLFLILWQLWRRRKREKIAQERNREMVKMNC